MKNKLTPIFALAGFLVAAIQANAASLVDGSAQSGKAKAIACGACHGADGNATIPGYPNLAGQHAPYLLAQLKAFKDGSRQDPIMSSQVIMINEQDMADLVTYFESLPAPAQAVANPDLVTRGESLYRGGNTEKGIPACLACHGPSGRGNPAAQYPALQGQHASYITKQLKAYASGTRQTDGKSRVMRDIASRLGDEDIDALASYMQGLR